MPCFTGPFGVLRVASRPLSRKRGRTVAMIADPAGKNWRSTRMFVLKNAWSSIVRRKWRTLLTMFIAIIVTFGTLFGFSVLHADESATDGYNPPAGQRRHPPGCEDQGNLQRRRFFLYEELPGVRRIRQLRVCAAGRRPDVQLCAHHHRAGAAERRRQGHRRHRRPERRQDRRRDAVPQLLFAGGRA